MQIFLPFQRLIKLFCVFTLMRKILLLFFLFAVIHTGLFAQSSELGLMLGASTYKGELNEHLFNTKFVHPAAGLYLRRCLNSFWSFRLGANYGRISGSDAKSNNEFNKFRNLSFRSDIIEANAVFEFNFFPYQTASESSNKATPYLMFGIAFFHFNPKAKLDGAWYELQPLGTEGQGSGQENTTRSYRRIQFALPIGGGFKFKLSNRFTLAIEAAARRTYTDYLDDVSTTYPDVIQLEASKGPVAAALSDRSPLQNTNQNAKHQRGNKSDKDWYMFSGLTINWTLSKKYTDKCKPFRTKLR